MVIEEAARAESRCRTAGGSAPRRRILSRVARLRLHLRDGVTPAYAAQILRDRELLSGNLGAIGGGPAVAKQLRDGYTEWVEDTEAHLASLTLDADVLTMLHTERYWHIRAMDEATTRPWPLVDAEVRTQAGALDRLARDLSERAARATAAPGWLTVIDTNILLHYQLPSDIPWTELVREPAVRLVVPLRVVEELDAKKYARRDNLADRARRILPWLKRVVGPAGAPGELRPFVTIEVPTDPGPRQRPLDADEEILEGCEELRQFSGRSVTLVTGDIGMVLRAEARAISVVQMSEEYASRRPSAPDLETPS
jgi:hypothetical protein